MANNPQTCHSRGSLSAWTVERAGVGCRSLGFAKRGIDFPQVAAQAGQPDADPFDLLCHLAFSAPVLTRRPPADRVEQEQAASEDFEVELLEA